MQEGTESDPPTAHFPNLLILSKKQKNENCKLKNEFFILGLIISDLHPRFFIFADRHLQNEFFLISPLLRPYDIVPFGDMIAKSIKNEDHSLFLCKNICIYHRKSVPFAAESRLEKCSKLRKSRLEKYIERQKSRLKKYKNYAEKEDLQGVKKL